MNTKQPTPAQVKLQAMLARAKAHLSSATVAQVKAVQALVKENGVHDIDLSNLVPASAPAHEKEEALDTVISVISAPQVTVASAASEASERHTYQPSSVPAQHAQVVQTAQTAPTAATSAINAALQKLRVVKGVTPTIAASVTPEASAPVVAPVPVAPAQPEQPDLATAVASVLSVSPKLGVMQDISLNEEQRKAADLILSGTDLVLIGKAGTGKTTMMKTAMSELIASQRIPMIQESTKYLLPGLPGVAVVSYTNKAVNNIRHAMPGEVKPHTLTLHKLLEFEPVYYEVVDEATGKSKKTMRFEPSRNQYNPLPASLKFIAFEESSMIGTGLHQYLLNALPHKVQFLYIGDIRQLPPVFDQAVLGYKMLELPVVELTKVYRQALESPILRCALTLDDGKVEEFRPGSPTKDPKTKKNVWPGLAKWNEKGPHGSLTFQPWQREVPPVEALGNLRLFFKMQWEAGVYNPKEDIILCPFQKEANELGQKLMSCHNLNAMILDFLSRDRGAIVHEVMAGFNKHYWAEGDRVLYQKEDAVITRIVRNGKYLGKPVKDPSLYMNRYGVIDEEHLGDQKDAVSEEFYDPILGKVVEGKFNEMDAEALLNSLGNVKDNERVNQASHIITVYCPVNELTVELFTAAEVNDLLGGHALTVHKAQGSEWERVYLVLHHTHKIAISRELVYTAFTRARTHLHVFTHPEGMALACKNQRIKGNTIEEKAEFFKGKRDKDTVAKEEAERREKEAAKIVELKAAIQAKLEECMDKAIRLWPDRRHDMVVKLLYMDCGDAAGVAHFGDGKNCVIKISPTYLKHDADDALNDTIPHELAHLYAARWFGCRDHGKDWKEIAEALGAKPEQYHHMPHAAAIRGNFIK